MIDRRAALPWVFGLALLAVLVAWFLATHRRVEKIESLPPKGEASYNPLYALKISLQAVGQRVETRQRLDLDTLALGPDDTVLVYSDSRSLGDAELDALFAFAESGGHLVLRLPPWQGKTPDTVLADWLPIAPLLQVPGCMALGLPGQQAREVFCRDARFRLQQDAEVSQVWRNAAGQAVYARFVHGEGSVDLVSSLDLLQNNRLSEPGHAHFARQLLAPHWGEGTLHLVYAADMPPLWLWLLTNAWRVLLPLLLGLLAWLWMRTPRFGPVLPSPLPPRRALLEHVDASGEHLLRYGKHALLHRAMRESVLALLRRRDPLAAAMEGETQAALLVTRTGLAATDIRAMLDTRPPATPHEFRQRIARLIALRKRL